MRKHIAVLSALGAVALATTVPAASAEAAVFSPSPMSTTFSGSLTFTQGPGPLISCYVSMDVAVARGGRHAEVSNVVFGPGDWQCGVLAAPLSLPWYLYPDTTTQVTLDAVHMQAYVATCSGSLVATWSSGPPSTMTFSSAALPGLWGACTLSGTLTASTPLTIL